jgi:viologen exporter family transport system ATP-binding protein
MALIEARDLKKQYRVNVKRDGLAGAILNLVKPRYQIKEAVKGISFLVNQSEMIGYIGANGAGKSTTIKMLTGILTPTSGEVIVDGLVPNANRTKNNMKIGVVFGQRTQMWWDIPVIESYKLIQKIYEVPIDTYKRNLKWYAEYLDINDLLKLLSGN